MQDFTTTKNCLQFAFLEAEAGAVEASGLAHKTFVGGD